MKIIKFVLIFFTFLFFFSCNSSTEPNNFSNKDFSIGIINMDQGLVATETNKLLSDLFPKISSDDPYGQRENISTFIDRINSKCDNISAELICYACILTYPPQSEILLTTDSASVSITRTIDISTSSEDKLSFVRIHEYSLY